MSRFLKRFLIIVPLLGAIVGFGAGWSIWRAQAAVSSDSMGAWLWLFGGFVTFAGGVALVRHSRWLGVAYIFAGFVLLLSAGFYLPEARRVYDEWQSRLR